MCNFDVGPEMTSDFKINLRNYKGMLSHLTGGESVCKTTFPATDGLRRAVDHSLRKVTIGGGSGESVFLDFSISEPIFTNTAG